MILRLLIAVCSFFLFTPAFAAEDYAAQAFRFADSKLWPQANSAASMNGGPLLKEFIQWRRLKDYETRADANEILRFVEQHRDWPDINLLLDRAEESLMLEGVHWEQAKRWQDLHESLLEKKLKDSSHKDPVSYLIRHGWQYGQFNTAEQENIRRAYPSQIGEKEIIRRVNRLLWEDQPNQAQPLIPLLPGHLQKIAYARIALQTNQFGIEKLLAAMPAEYRNDPSILYERMRWRDRKQLDSGVQELLLQAPAKVPYPDKWWPLRVVQVRDEIQSGNIDKALRLLANHGQTSDATLADTLWLSGWLKLTRKQDAGEAYKDFYALFHHVKFPVSISRGAYWAGLAAKRNNNPDIAANWFKEAAKFPTTFYGQLALAELGPNRPLALSPAPGSGAQASFPPEQRRMLDLIRLLARYDQKVAVEKFVMHLAKIQTAPSNLYALGNMMRELRYPHLSVRVGKVAAQEQHLFLGTTSHPMINTSKLMVEPALALAVSRQESEFNPDARSSANAQGLMQLLPSTAKQVARQWGIPHSPAKLCVPNHNIQLGSCYLAGLIDKYDGSYPLAIAAYNAGPGNVGKWIAQRGRPPADTAGKLQWIESIPFAETRNYVQRVLENLQVYRVMLKENEPLTERRLFGR